MTQLRHLLAQRELVYGMNRRNIELVYANNARADYVFADDKLLAKEILSAAGVAVPKTLAVCRGLFEIPAALAALNEAENFVVKPADASGGQGIMVVGRCTAPGQWQRIGGKPLSAEALRTHLANIVFGVFARGDLSDKAFVEERVVAHPLIDALWQEGLADVRVITLRGQPVMAMLRVPTASSGGRANLHQGGLGLAVDLDSGKVRRAVRYRQALTHHPDNGAALLGLQLPHWPAILETARRAAAAVPLGFLGVDIVIDATRGPLVLEINARPGMEIQNVHGIGLGAQLRAVGATA